MCVLPWRIPGTGEPGGLPSMGSHRVGHDWSDLAAAAAHSVFFPSKFWIFKTTKQNLISTVCETDSAYNLRGIQRQVTDGYSGDVCGERGTHMKSGRKVSFTQADGRTRLSGRPASVPAGGHTLSTSTWGWEQKHTARTGLSFLIWKGRILMPTSVWLFRMKCETLYKALSTTKHSVECSSSLLRLLLTETIAVLVGGGPDYKTMWNPCRGVTEN